jgi:hypothetical protein
LIELPSRKCALKIVFPKAKKIFKALGHHNGYRVRSGITTWTTAVVEKNSSGLRVIDPKKKDSGQKKKYVRPSSGQKMSF